MTTRQASPDRLSPDRSPVPGSLLVVVPPRESDGNSYKECNERSDTEGDLDGRKQGTHEHGATEVHRRYKQHPRSHRCEIETPRPPQGEERAVSESAEEEGHEIEGNQFLPWHPNAGERPRPEEQTFHCDQQGKQGRQREARPQPRAQAVAEACRATWQIGVY